MRRPRKTLPTSDRWFFQREPRLLGISCVRLPVGGDALSDTGGREGAPPAAVNGPAEPSGPVAEPTSAEPTNDGALIVSTVYDNPRSKLRAPLFAAPAAEGELDSNGLFTPDSKGAFGRPDVKVYTPTSEGSHGTVLLSAQKNMHLESGTRLLLVVQPPPSAELDATTD